MPKRNRHREAAKAGQLPPMKLATVADVAKPAPADKPAPTAPPASKPEATKPPTDPEKKRIAKRMKEGRYRERLKDKALSVVRPIDGGLVELLDGCVHFASLSA